MAIVQNGTNKYIDHPIIVDAGGSTPFTTVASGITAAVGLGLGAPTTVFIKSGTYTEDLTLVNGINLQGENEHTTIIDGSHTVPAAGTFKASHLKFSQTTPATDVFVEGGAGACAIDVVDCIFNIDSGIAFNLPTSTGPISIIGCSDISAANSIINNTTGASILTIRNSDIGSGAVAAEIGGITNIHSSAIHVSLTFNGTASSFIRNCSMTSDGVNTPKITTNDTVVVYISDTTINSGAGVTIDVAAAGATVYLCNTGVISTVGGGNCIIGLGTIQLDEVTFWTAKGVTTATQLWDSRIATGSLQLDKANTGNVYLNAGLLTPQALTDGQLQIGSTGAAPSAATLTAGSGIAITNGAGTISIAATASFTWVQVGADGALVVNQGSIDTKAGLLTMSLPAVSAVGDVIILQGLGAGGWTITQAANQQIIVGNQATTLGAGGTLSSTNANDSISLVCTTANLVWSTYGMIGNLTIV